MAGTQSGMQADPSTVQCDSSGHSPCNGPHVTVLPQPSSSCRVRQGDDSTCRQQEAGDFQVQARLHRSLHAAIGSRLWSRLALVFACLCKACTSERLAGTWTACSDRSIACTLTAYTDRLFASTLSACIGRPPEKATGARAKLKDMHHAPTVKSSRLSASRRCCGVVPPPPVTCNLNDSCWLRINEQQARRSDPVRNSEFGFESLHQPALPPAPGARRSRLCYVPSPLHV